jgi:transposase
MERQNTNKHLMLPGAAFGFPLKWHEGEALYSLCSRYHRLSLSLRNHQTSQVLFGHRRGGHAHDFPSHIENFVEATGGALGTALEVIEHHTVVPYFLPFRSPSLSTNAVQAMRGPGIKSLKFQLGLLTSRFRAHHPLKFCVQCAIRDVESGHPPYWRLAHQFPGTWLCREHERVLDVSPLKSTGVGRFGWILPDEAMQERPGTTRMADESVLQDTSLRRFSLMCEALGSTPLGTHFSPPQLVNTFTTRLGVQGLLTSTGGLHARRASASLAEFSQAFAKVVGLSALVVDERSAYSQIQLLRTAQRAQTHPLRHLWLISWLYTDWSDFVTAYRSSSPAQANSGTAPTIRKAATSPTANPKRPLCIALMTASGYSANRAATQVGVATGTAMAWAAQAGITPARRPKKLDPVLRTELLAALRLGISKTEAASRFSLSVQTVTTTLRTEPGLHLAWTQAWRALEQGRRREAWVQGLELHPTASQKELRQMRKADFAWLYRNDRDWLMKQFDCRPKPPRSNNTSVSWTQRDHDLCELVRAASQAIQGGNRSARAGRKISLWEIYQQVPGLKPQLRHLDRLPKTRAALADAVGTIPSAKDQMPLF